MSKLSIEVAEGANNNAQKPLQSLLNSRPEQSLKIPTLVLRQSSNGGTDWVWMWMEWPAMQQYRPQIEQVVGNFRPYTSQWSQMMGQVPGFEEIANQYNNIGSQVSGMMNPSAIFGQLQNGMSG